jgi:hypothetical protein
MLLLATFIPQTSISPRIERPANFDNSVIQIERNDYDLRNEKGVRLLYNHNTLVKKYLPDDSSLLSIFCLSGILFLYSKNNLISVHLEISIAMNWYIKP